MGDIFSNAIPRGPIKEVQILKLKAESGSFSLAFGGSSTPVIAYDASPKQVEGALENLENVGAVTVEKTSNPNGYLLYKIVFDTASGDLPALTINATQLLSNASNIAVYAKVHYCDKYRVQQIRTASIAEGYRRPTSPGKGNTSIGGTFRLRYNGAWTADISHAGTEIEVKEKLEALPDIYTVSVKRSSPDPQGGYTWTVNLLSVEGPRLEIYAEGHLLYGVGENGEYGTAVVQVDELREGEFITYCEGDTKAGRYGDDFVVTL